MKSPAPDRPHDAPTPAAARTTEVYGFACDLQRSIRYHKARERFFQRWSDRAALLGLVSGTAVAVSILSGLPSWAGLSAAGLVALSQAASLIGAWSARARDHAGFAAEFAALERFATLGAPLSTARLKELRGELLAIEAREPPVKRYLDLLCHNQVARAVGSDDIERLTWTQRTFAQYLDGEGASSKPPLRRPAS